MIRTSEMLIAFHHKLDWGPVYNKTLLDQEKFYIQQEEKLKWELNKSCRFQSYFQLHEYMMSNKEANLQKSWIFFY